MADPTTPLLARVAKLEADLAELKNRLALLERSVGLAPAPAGEHPVDQRAVREKVTYDWQS